MASQLARWLVERTVGRLHVRLSFVVRRSSVVVGFVDCRWSFVGCRSFVRRSASAALQLRRCSVALLLLRCCAAALLCCFWSCGARCAAEGAAVTCYCGAMRAAVRVCCVALLRCYHALRPGQHTPPWHWPPPCVIESRTCRGCLWAVCRNACTYAIRLCRLRIIVSCVGVSGSLIVIGTYQQVASKGDRTSGGLVFRAILP